MSASRWPVNDPAGGQPALTTAIAIVITDLDAAFSALDEAERETPRLAADQIARFEHLKSRGHKDAGHWRAAHIALRIMLERHSGSAVRHVSYDIAPGGRPHFVSSQSLPRPPYFSLSHTGRFALFAVSQSEPIGVDLELPRAVSITPVRRARIEVAAQELSTRDQLPGEADARFLQAWVRLEAAAKASGEGIGRTLTKAGAIGAGRLPGHPSTAAAMPSSAVCVRDLVLGSGLFGAVAGRTLPPIVTVETMPTDAAGLAAFLRAPFNAGQ